MSKGGYKIIDQGGMYFVSADDYKYQHSSKPKPSAVIVKRYLKY